jgi:hypothetical protein
MSNVHISYVVDDSLVYIRFAFPHARFGSSFSGSFGSGGCGSGFCYYLVTNLYQLIHTYTHCHHTPVTMCSSLNDI